MRAGGGWKTISSGTGDEMKIFPNGLTNANNKNKNNKKKGNDFYNLFTKQGEKNNMWLTRSSGEVRCSLNIKLLFIKGG